MGDVLRVGLCDDHGIVRAGLRRILQEEPDVDVVGEAATATAAIELVLQEAPDVLVLDVGLPDQSGLSAIPAILAASPETRVLVLTVHDDVAYLRRAFDLGAAGYLVKEAADVELVLAVRQVAAGQQYVFPALGAALLTADAGPDRPAGPGGRLSERELEVLRLLAAGLTNAEVASELFVSVRTVETHRASLQRKLDVHHRADLVRIAHEYRLLDPPLG